jgi:hypothetical protein
MKSIGFTVPKKLGDSIRHPECKRIMRDIPESYARLARLTKDFQNAAATSLTVNQQKRAVEALKEGHHHGHVG